MSNAGNRILKSIRQARAYARGEATEGFVAHVPEDVDVRAIRHGLGLSQEAFALRFGFSPAAVRDWEQHRRQPEQAARVLLLVIAHNPEAVSEALIVGHAVSDEIRGVHRIKPTSGRSRTGPQRHPAPAEARIAEVGRKRH
jgi:putative transcriptional regulator